MPLKNPRLKALCVYLFASFIIAVIAYFTRKQGNNVFIQYIHTPITYISCALLFLPENTSPKLRKAIFASIGLMLLLLVYEGFFREGGFAKYNNLSQTFTCLVVGAMAIRYIIRLRFDPQVQDLRSEPMFWFGVAFAILNIANIMADAFYRSLQNTEGDLLLKVVASSMVVNYLATFTYWVGLTKVKR